MIDTEQTRGYTVKTSKHLSRRIVCENDEKLSSHLVHG